MYTYTLLATACVSSLALGQKLTKPALEGDLDYLKQGLMDHLPIAHSTYEQWNGYIPADCQSIAQEAKLNPSDVTAYNVTYNDCHAPWILCRHKDSPSPVGNLIDYFGRVPVHMRQWVRHMVALPDPNGAAHAYNANGNIAIFDKIEDDVTVFIHETGHSLDLLGAYTDKPLSSSKYWLTQYALDSNVPDDYAQTNQIEDVAQNTVVATFNEVVPGGFASVEKNPGATFHQYATLQTEADAAAPGNILKPGGQCTHRLTNSNPVKLLVTAGDAAAAGTAAGVGQAIHNPPTTPGYGRIMRIMRREQDPNMPDVSLPEDLEVIPPVKFNTKEHCKHI